MLASRFAFAIFIGVLLTPIAGFMHLLAGVSSPFLMGLLASPLGFLLPVIAGAQHAWLLTFVILPLTSLFLRPSRYWTPFVYLAIGCIGSGLLGRGFFVANVFTGGLVGLIFGWALWRFDSHAAANPSKRPSYIADGDWKLFAVCGALFLMTATGYLALVGPGAK